MNLLEKAAEYQKSINMAMADYEKAKKAFEKSNGIKWNLKVTAGTEEVDLQPYSQTINDFMAEIVSDITGTRKALMESAKMRLAVLIGDKDTAETACDSVEETQNVENEKEDETHVEEKKPVEKANKEQKHEDTDTQDDENWHTKANLYELYINEGVKVKDIALLYGVATPTVYGYLKEYGLSDLKKTMEKDKKYCGKRP